MVGSGWLILNTVFPERSYYSHLKHIHPACTAGIPSPSQYTWSRTYCWWTKRCP